MKKYMLFLCLFSMCSLFACQEKEDTPEYIELINICEGEVFLLLDNIENNHGVNKISSINNFSAEQFASAYNLIVIDVSKHYDELGSENVTQLYVILESSHNVMVVFWKAENDYNFFRDTPFANGKEYYENIATMNIYFNFRSSADGISQYDSSTNVLTLAGCLENFSEDILAHRGSM